MALFPGHLRALGSQPDAALAVLLLEYNDYPPFVEDCLHVKALQITSSWSSSRRQLEVFARRWNLDRMPVLREMRYYHLERAVHQTGERIGNTVAGPFRPFSIGRMIWSGDEPTVTWRGRSWAWRLSSQESLAGFRDRITADLGLRSPRQLPHTIADQIRAAPAEAREQGWLLADIRHELATQARWLFLRPSPISPGRPAASSGKNGRAPTSEPSGAPSGTSPN